MWEILGTQKSTFSGSAKDVTYDDSETKLGATNVQDAFGKLSATVNDMKENGTGTTVTGGSVKTILENIMTIMKAQVQINADGTTTPQAYNPDISDIASQTDRLIANLGTTDEPDTPVEPDVPEVTLSSISATYSGGEVTVGTALTDLTGITVTGTYSDGSTSAITGYTLSGEIAEGNNTITVSFEGKTTTFTVVGYVEQEDTTYYSITNNLTNVTTSNSTSSVEENTSYTATLTENDGYMIDSITVTMGGEDITASVVANGVITIPSVTGNVVITAIAIEEVVESTEPVYKLASATTLDGTSGIDSGYILNDVDKDFSICMEYTPASSGGYLFDASKNANIYGPYLTNSIDNNMQIGSSKVTRKYVGDTVKTKFIMTHEKGSGVFNTFLINTKLNFIDTQKVVYESYATNGHTVGNTNTLKIGAKFNNASFFNGTIHQFEVYERVLTSEEIDTFMESTWVEPTESINLINKDTLTNDGTMPNGASISTDYYITDYIPITYGNPYITNITKYIDETNTGVHYMYFYNTNKIYKNVTGLDFSTPMGTYTNVTGIILNNEGSAYVRLVFHKNYLDTAFFGEGLV